jgi:uncharacterized protein (DUF1919 family)
MEDNKDALGGYDGPMFQIIEEGEEFYFPKLRAEVRYRKEKFGYLITFAGFKPLIVNDTFVEIMNMCDGDTAVRDIAEQLSQKYDEDFNEMLDHVEDVVEYLERYEYLEKVLRWDGLYGYVADTSSSP